MSYRSYRSYRKGHPSPLTTHHSLLIRVALLDAVHDVVRGLGYRDGSRRRLATCRLLAAVAAAADGGGLSLPPGSFAAAGLGRRRLPGLRAEARHHVRPAPLVPLDVNEPVARGVLEQLAERPVAVVFLVERRLLPLHGVLHHRREKDLLVLAAYGQERLKQDGVDLLLGLGQLRR